MTEKNLFAQVQHGFIARISCCAQLLDIMEDLTEELDNGKDVDIFDLDFCKAFNKIPHK